MARPVHLLVVGDQPGIPEELESAIAGIRDLAVILHVAPDYRRGIEEARSRQPGVVCFAMPDTQDELRAFTSELAVVAPQAVPIGLIQSQAFATGDAESAFLIEALRLGVRDFLHQPISAGELGDSLARNLRQGGEAKGDGLGSICCFISNKGGVGKSTLAVNTACELARRSPGRVLLVDAALQLGLCGTMLDLQPTTTLLDAAGQIDRLDPLLLRQLVTPHSSGVHLLPAPPDPVSAAQIDDETMSRVLSVARRAYDVVVVDTFPMLDSLALAILDRADRAFVVLTPSVPTVIGAERLLVVLDKCGVDRDRQSIILNCALPRHTGRLHGEEVATRLGRSIDHYVPFSRGAMAGANTGEPQVLQPSRVVGGFAKAVREIAGAIQGVPPRQARRPRRRLAGNKPTEPSEPSLDAQMEAP